MANEERKYFVFCEDNCKFEAMTKEQTIAAIAEATGHTPEDVDAAFITKIKEQNKNTPLKLWIGSQAEYNALEEIDPNCFYIFNDTDELPEILQAAEEKAEEVCAPLVADVEDIKETLNKKGVVLFDATVEGVDPIPYGECYVEVEGISKYTVLQIQTAANQVLCVQTFGSGSSVILGSGTMNLNKDSSMYVANVNMTLAVDFEVIVENHSTACTFTGGNQYIGPQQNSIIKIIGIM